MNRRRPRCHVYSLQYGRYLQSDGARGVPKSAWNARFRQRENILTDLHHLMQRLEGNR